MKNRILFRGFFPTDTGTECLRIGSATSYKEVKGRWIYWNGFGLLCYLSGTLVLDDLKRPVHVNPTDVLEETVSQLVFVDKDKRYFFCGAILEEIDTGDIFELVENGNCIAFGVKLLKRGTGEIDKYCGNIWDFSRPSRFKIIGCRYTKTEYLNMQEA